MRYQQFRDTNRLAWLWLAIGASLLPFSMFQTVWPLAAWVSPVLLMRFSRTQRLRIGFPVIWLVLCIGFAVGWRDDFVPLPLDIPTLQSAMIRGGAVVFAAGLGGLPYALDGLMGQRLQGAARALVFPLAAVTVEYVSTLTLHPVGGLAAYTQYGNLPLMQLASVTGIWGLSFVVNWFAPVVNELWERGTSARVLRSSLLPFGVVLAAVVVYGSARLTFAPDAPAVRVAGLTPDRTLYLRTPGGEEIVWPDIEQIARASDAERAQWRSRWLAVTDDLLARSRQQARAGAKIITWAEESAFLLSEDVPTVLEQARSVAREEGVYLQLGLQPILHTQQFPFAENRAVLIDPSGSVVWDYHKAHPIPFAESLEYDGGPEIAPYVDTPYGRIAGVICYDTDFVPYMHQAASAQVGLLLAPANDWPAVKYDHTHEAVYRAVENGFSMMRPDVKGISLAVDPFGRELTTADYFTTDRLDIVAMMPVQAVPTLYSRIGDVFAWLGMVALVAIAAQALVRRPKPVSMPGSEAVKTPLARGYLMKDADQQNLLRAIHAVNRGEAIFSPSVAHRLMGNLRRSRQPASRRKRFPELSSRELEVVRLIAEGQSNPAIAARLALSVKTVQNHISNIFSKLQVADRAHAIVRAREAGLGTG